MFTDLTAAGDGGTVQPIMNKRTFQAVGTTSSGAGTATVKIWVSNDNVGFLLLGTITLVLATTVTAGLNADGFASDAPWKYVYAELDAVTGTGAAVTCTMGCEY